MMRVLLGAAAAFVLAGCTAQVALVSPTGSVSHLTARKSDHSLRGIVDGTPFSGTIITNESMAFGVGQSFGGGTTSTGFSQMYMGGNSGRAMLVGQSGESIQCQFNYQSGAALGECLRDNGIKYMLTTNPPTQPTEKR